VAPPPFDLNLLVGLDALLEEGSVTGAAERLHLSVPAMSRQLARIRRATGDQIMTRSGRGLVPTPFALALQPDVRRLLEQAEQLLHERRRLDLATLDRTFTIRSSDAVVTAIGAELLAAVHESAPRVSIRFLPEGAEDAADLRSGQVDVDVGALDSLPNDISTEVAATEEAVAVGRPEVLSKRRLSLEDFCAIPHVMVSRRGIARGPIDQLLEQQGLTRHVAMTVPSFTSALFAVLRGDYLSVVPRGLAVAAARDLAIAIRPIPLDLPTFDIGLAWHQRFDDDPAHRWFRDQVMTQLRSP
jgi:DNA-binding transcriptional LysR family regulator